MYKISGNTVRISVRGLVEFICRSGDIDNRSGGGVRTTRQMLIGAKMHRQLQKAAGSAYQPEVALKMTVPLFLDDCKLLLLEGRADGIITTDLGVTVDEIKTMTRDVDKIKDADYVHKAQALVYAYIYSVQNNLSSVTVRLTYANPDTQKVHYFTYPYSFEELDYWFRNLMKEWKKWMRFLFTERALRQESIKDLAFPYPYREGQKNLVVSVYRSMEKEKNLYIQAPTGTGKTISTIFPAVQIMGQEKADKIFYLTSKTITRTVAEDTYALLRDAGLHFRAITLTAKEKICPTEDKQCNPVACRYARGHYDRINEAVYDCITHEQVITREVVESYSMKHQVCPFELALDISTWCDGLICDYNYAFDPDVKLARYFGEGVPTDEYLFLVDEAHNLVDRARTMYSGMLVKEQFLRMKKLLKSHQGAKKLVGLLERANRVLLEYKRMTEGGFHRFGDCEKLLPALDKLTPALTEFLDKHRGFAGHDELLNFYFDVRHFINMYEYAGSGYVIYSDFDINQNFQLHLACVDPSMQLSECLEFARSTIFFSATLLPVNYFKEMLSGNTKETAVYATSVFSSDAKEVYIASDVSSRMSRRGPAEYERIADYIHTMSQVKEGNYMAYFPSYSFMMHVQEVYEKKYPHDKVLAQNTHMTEEEKEAFLNAFEAGDVNVIGFCVNGGIFSEGIDLTEDKLIGVAVVGTGLPMICRENNILKDYYNEHGKDGFTYAYVYPGMNKVMQAAGRVIRTTKDRGVILLLDDRFLNMEYRQLYPREWDRIKAVRIDGVEEEMRKFWGDLI